jgi:hypothetical protein
LIKYARPIEKIAAVYPTKYLVTLVNRIFGMGDYGNRWINGVHKHAKAREIKNYVGENIYNKYFKFSIVRNPYDLQVSLYHYIKQSKGHRDYGVANKLNFKEFVRREIKNEASRQSDFLTDYNGNLIVDYIGKTEELQQSMDEICNEIGIDVVDLGHKNKSDRKSNYMSYYDEKLKKEVYNYFNKDFELFGYEK